MRHLTKDDAQKLNNMQPQYNMGYQSRFDLPPGLEDDTKRFCWVNNEIRGKPTRHVDDADRKGYDIVRPIKNLERRGSRDLMKTRQASDQCLYNIDTVCMSIDKELYQRYEQNHNHKSHQAVKSLVGVQNIHSGSGRIKSF